MRQSDLTKLIDEVAKVLAKNRGWKFSRGYIFRRTEKLFFALLIIGNAKNQNLRHVFFYKWYDFDDLFWKIVELPENSEQPLSFRASGAWTAPMTEVESGDESLVELDRETITKAVIPILDNCEKLMKEMAVNLKTLDDNLAFLRAVQEEHLKLYPGSARTIYVQEVLNLILKGERQQALKLIEERIVTGNSGDFGFGKKTFFTAAKLWTLSH